MLCNAVGVGGFRVPRKKHSEGVRFNIIRITRGWVGVKFPGFPPILCINCAYICTSSLVCWFHV